MKERERGRERVSEKSYFLMVGDREEDVHQQVVDDETDVIFSEKADGREGSAAFEVTGVVLA